MTGVCAACGARTDDEHAACPQCGEGLGDAPAVAAPVPPGSREQGRVPENVAAALTYVTVIPAIVFLVTKPYSKNEFVRFHAFQCVALAVVSTAIAAALLLLANVSSINLLLIPFSLILAIAIALILLVCMIKAFQHQMYSLPVLGPWAHKQCLRS
jgi:uncharacterized membrane protein